MTSSHLLIPEPPLQVLPSLAASIGLNEAIVLQQVHYWLQPRRGGGKTVDGVRWIYNSYDQWQRDNFPFWSTRTIQRIVKGLEDEGLLLSTDDLNDDSRDRTKWYTINYQHEALSSQMTDMESASGQVVEVDHDKVARSSYTETTSETTGSPQGHKLTDQIESAFDSWWSVYPRKVKKADARKAFQKINPDPTTLARMIADVAARTRSKDWTEDDGKFIPHPPTYLNQRRWEDEDNVLPTPAPDRDLTQDELKQYSRWDTGWQAVYGGDSAGWRQWQQDFFNGTLRQRRKA